MSSLCLYFIPYNLHIGAKVIWPHTFSNVSLPNQAHLGLKLLNTSQYLQNKFQTPLQIVKVLCHRYHASSPVFMCHSALFLLSAAISLNYLVLSMPSSFYLPYALPLHSSSSGAKLVGAFLKEAFHDIPGLRWMSLL